MKMCWCYKRLEICIAKKLKKQGSYKRLGFETGMGYGNERSREMGMFDYVNYRYRSVLVGKEVKAK